MATSESCIIVDDEGDVTLVCGKAHGEPTPSKTLDQATTHSPIRSLVVSSHALRLSSEPFGRMRASLFKEGIELAEKGSVTIPLPEDDGEAMTVICNIIHHRNTLVPTKIDSSLLHNIAVLSDKYDFNEALKPTVTTWVRDYVSDKGDNHNRQSRVSTWTELLLSAHFLRHQKLAQMALQGLIFQTTFPPQHIDIQTYPIPPKLLECLRENQLRVLHDIRNIVGEAVSGIIDYQVFHRPACDTLVQATNTLMSRLFEEGLWPWQRQRNFDLEAVLIRLEGLHFDVTDRGGWKCRLGIPLCWCSSAPSADSMARQIREGAAKLRERIENVQVDF